MVDLNIRLINRKLFKDRKIKCEICGESEKCCLELHHIKDKQYSISQAVKKLPTRLFINELNKCICVCANCHRKIHKGIIKL